MLNQAVIFFNSKVIFATNYRFNNWPTIDGVVIKRWRTGLGIKLTWVGVLALGLLVVSPGVSNLASLRLNFLICKNGCN